MEVKTTAELQAMYDFVGPFFEGLAWVRKDGRWFQIHLDGTPACEQRHNCFVDEVALVRRNGRYFRIRPDEIRATDFHVISTP